MPVGRISAIDGGIILRKVSPIGTKIEEEDVPYDAIRRVGSRREYGVALAIAVGAVSGSSSRRRPSAPGRSRSALAGEQR